MNQAGGLVVVGSNPAAPTKFPARNALQGRSAPSGDSNSGLGADGRLVTGYLNQILHMAPLTVAHYASAAVHCEVTPGGPAPPLRRSSSASADGGDGEARDS